MPEKFTTAVIGTSSKVKVNNFWLGQDMKGTDKTGLWALNLRVCWHQDYAGPEREILIDVGTSDNFLKEQLKPENFTAAVEGTPK